MDIAERYLFSQYVLYLFLPDTRTKAELTIAEAVLMSTEARLTSNHAAQSHCIYLFPLQSSRVPKLDSLSRRSAPLFSYQG